MNLVLLLTSDFINRAEGLVRLTGRRHEHIRSIHRADVGDELRVGLLEGLVGTGVVTSADEEAIELTVKLTDSPPPPLPLTLILALPRPNSLKKVLWGVTAMGVKEIVLIGSRRVEKSYWQSPVLTDENLREEMILGLEQARDTMLPTVRQAQYFKPFVEDELPALVRGRLGLVAHPTNAKPCPRNVESPVTLVVGPEGGFTDYEIGRLEEAGLLAVTLGERTLRVEHAVPALLGRLF